MEVLLVHGSTQSPQSWGRLADVLTERGHRCVAVDFPVDAPELTAAEYAAIAAEQAAALDRPVTVAHSLGGLLLPAVAAAVDAPHLVWLGALIPDFAGGRDALEMIKDDSAEMFTAEWHTWEEDVVAAPAISAYFLFHDCDAPTLRWALPSLRLFQPRAVLSGPPGPAPEAPSTFVVPADDRTLRPDWMRRAAAERLAARVVDVPGGHCPHVSRPETVADVIVAASGP